MSVSSVLRREPAQLPPPIPELYYHYRRPKLDEIDMGFAGRHGANHRMHHHLAALYPGDPLQACQTKQGRWELLDQDRNRVGRLAKKNRRATGNALSVRQGVCDYNPQAGTVRSRLSGAH